MSRFFHRTTTIFLLTRQELNISITVLTNDFKLLHDTVWYQGDFLQNLNIFPAVNLKMLVINIHFRQRFDISHNNASMNIFLYQFQRCLKRFK